MRVAMMTLSLDDEEEYEEPRLVMSPRVKTTFAFL